MDYSNMIEEDEFSSSELQVANIEKVEEPTIRLSDRFAMGFATILSRTLVLAAIPFLILYLLVPALFFFVPRLMQHVFFLNFVCFPFVNYSDLPHHGVKSRGRNFYLDRNLESANRKSPDDHKKKFQIGVWHILPRSLSDRLAEKESEISEAEFEKLLDSESHGIFIYLHGNSFDRTTVHRVELYNVLSALDFHILAIDYRGYGDSKGHPDEDGLIADAKMIYDYAKKHAPSKNIYVWGHSMGTGVASRAVAEFSDVGNPPEALVLESPFNNLYDVIKHHPFSTMFRFLPYFDDVIIKPLYDSGLRMESDKSIKRISCPILILHANDDHIIPIDLGRKLAESGREANRSITFAEFEAERSFMHKYIHRAPELPEIVTEFLTKGQVSQRSKNRLNRNEGLNIDGSEENSE